MSKKCPSKKREKEKRYVRDRNVDSERSGQGSSGIPSQDSQDLSAAAAATALITEKMKREPKIRGISAKFIMNR
jgi:hypothetical protein